MTTVEFLACACGECFQEGGALYHHRKQVHGDDGSVAFAYVGAQMGRQNKLRRMANQAQAVVSAAGVPSSH